MALLLTMFVRMHLMNVPENDFFEVRCHFNLKRKLRIQKLQKLVITLTLCFFTLIQIFSDHFVVLFVPGGFILLLLPKELVSDFLQMFRSQLVPRFLRHNSWVQTISQQHAVIQVSLRFFRLC